MAPFTSLRLFVLSFVSPTLLFFLMLGCLPVSKAKAGWKH